MRKNHSLIATASALLVAGCLHLAFCEWRTLAYAIDQPEPGNRMLRFWRTYDATGNAEAWDRSDAELDRYNEAFVACYGPPTPRIEACVRAHPGHADTPTAVAVAISECESEHGDRDFQPSALRGCLASAGHDRVHVPNWTSQRIGLRFDGPFYRETALYAEARTARAPLDQALGWLLGIFAPAGLVGIGGLRIRSDCLRSRRGRSFPQPNPELDPE